MNNQITISNRDICVEISLMGAEIKNIKKSGKERLWKGDPKFWPQSAPILFPICGSLRNDTFRYKDRQYRLPKHGFAKQCEFCVQSVDKDRAVFLLCSDEKSKKIYPFDYEFRVIYELLGKELKITYDVHNLSGDDMYFSIGAHEGWHTPNGINEYEIEFERDEELLYTILDGPLLTHDRTSVGKGRLKLDYKYFSEDALVFLDLRSDSVVLRNIKTNEEVKVNFRGFDTLLLWTIPGAEFLCIEPWCGMPDYNDFDGDISEKAGIIRLSPNYRCIKEHSIEFADHNE